MSNEYKTIAFLCCRGGSKGIPGKNIRNFAGKPMLAWILEAALESGVFNEVVLSTDSEDISRVGEEYGAKIPELRPSYLAEDTSDQFDTHKYLFDLLGVSDQTHRVCNLNNNPFIDSKLIIDAFETLESTDFEGLVLDCLPVGGDFLYYRQCFELNTRLRMRFPEQLLHSQINRQNDSASYVAINNIRFGKPSILESYDNYKSHVVAHGIHPVWLPKTRNFDIDDKEDWAIAEAVFSNLFASQPA